MYWENLTKTIYDSNFAKKKKGGGVAVFQHTVVLFWVMVMTSTILGRSKIRQIMVKCRCFLSLLL